MKQFTCTQCQQRTNWPGRCNACLAADYDDFDDEDWEDDEAGLWDDCALMPDGQCLKAGTEECDWDCGRL